MQAPLTSLALLSLSLSVLSANSEKDDPPIVHKAEARSSEPHTSLVFAPGEPIIVKAHVTIPDTEYRIRWRIRGDVAYETFENDTILVMGHSPGEHHAEFLFVDFEAAVIVEEQFTILVQGRAPPIDDPEEPDDKKTTKAVVVYESSEQPIAPHAMAARPGIEEAGIEYRITDIDAKTGDGEVPRDLKPAIEAARAENAPFPVLVIQAGEVVTRVVPFPLTASEIVKEVTKK